jgi:hypothetical protein
MEHQHHRILCIGNDVDLLTSRCAVLATDGHEAELADPLEATPALHTTRFDLVILCTTLHPQQEQQFRNEVPAGTRILALTGFIRPAELLSAVAQLLGKTPDSTHSSGPFSVR